MTKQHMGAVEVAHSAASPAQSLTCYHIMVFYDMLRYGMLCYGVLYYAIVLLVYYVKRIALSYII